MQNCRLLLHCFFWFLRFMDLLFSRYISLREYLRIYLKVREIYSRRESHDLCLEMLGCSGINIIQGDYLKRFAYGTRRIITIFSLSLISYFVITLFGIRSFFLPLFYWRVSPFGKGKEREIGMLSFFVALLSPFFRAFLHLIAASTVCMLPLGIRT